MYYDQAGAFKCKVAAHNRGNLLCFRPVGMRYGPLLKCKLCCKASFLFYYVRGGYF